MLMNK